MEFSICTLFPGLLPSSHLRPEGPYAWILLKTLVLGSHRPLSECPASCLQTSYSSSLCIHPGQSAGAQIMGLHTFSDDCTDNEPDPSFSRTLDQDKATRGILEPPGTSPRPQVTMQPLRSIWPLVAAWPMDINVTLAQTTDIYMVLLGNEDH